MNFNIILACDMNNGIGKSHDLPWKLRKDMKYFNTTTTYSHIDTKQNVVIMGRKTYESIPKKYRPLPNRINIILSQTLKDEYEGNKVFASLESALDDCWKTRKGINKIFVIGGAVLYNYAYKNLSDRCNRVHLTRIYNSYDCDTMVDDIPECFKLEESSDIINEKGVYYRFETYINDRINEEQVYLNALKQIIDHGGNKIDRTLTGIKYVYGMHFRFNLREYYPLLTTKRVYFKGLVKELEMFVKGITDVEFLRKNKVHIWDDNTTREFLDGKGLTHYEEYTMGPTYSFNFRHYGADYIDKHTDYTNQGTDQLQNVIDSIKAGSTSRRLMIDLWNPSPSKHDGFDTVLDEMALPPCLFNYIFDLDVEKDEVNLQITMRSGDMFLGVPFNMANAGLLLLLVCNVTNKNPGDLVLNIANAHVYSNHVDQCLTQIKREIRNFPKLKINKKYNDIREFQYEDLELIDYNPHPTIKAKMAV